MGVPTVQALNLNNPTKITGTTGADYAAALAWICPALKTKTIFWKNTHGSLSVVHRLLATYGPDQTAGTEETLVAEATLTTGQTAKWSGTGAYYKLILQVKSATNPATFEVNYSGLGA